MVGQWLTILYLQHMKEMTKQLFESGAVFQLKQSNWSNYSQKYKYVTPEKEGDCGMICRAKDLFGGHECNITKVGTRSIKGYTYVLGKKVKIDLRFDQMVLFED